LLAALLSLSLGACGARSSLEAPPGAKPGKPASYCHSDSDTSVYVVSAQNALLRFDAPSGTFSPIGTLQCPTKSPSSPFSMAVDHQGTAHVIFDDGELFDVSAKDASCEATSFTPADSPVAVPFGSGFAATVDQPGETYFIAGSGDSSLATLDPVTFKATLIGKFSEDIGEVELTGTGDGRLFGFGVVVSGGPGAHFAEISPLDATVLSDTMVPTPANPNAWAFAFWGGDFYFFTSGGGQGTTIGKLHQEDGSFDPQYAVLPGETIVGAGVSTCAPL
jgi:predicted small lipoprotein YifL